MGLATLQALRDGQLTGARELRLGGCGLTEFPREIFGLAETLEVLDLGSNALTALPDDLGRLRKLRVLFCSGNPFARLPSVLGDCAALSQVGFRGCGLREIPAEALPPLLRWLTLTDNEIAALPRELGERPGLRKLMLSGNQLQQLPESLADVSGLELLRIAANRLEALPGWLGVHPSLAWIAWAGNPFDGIVTLRAKEVAWPELELGPLLGQGASGFVHRASLNGEPVALKLFKGAMTSDGLPGQEMAACLAAGDHPQLVGALGRLSGHPEGLEGLLMPLIPGHWRVLAEPPSVESCTRDVYHPALCLEPATALRMAQRVAAAQAHLHGIDLLHGDFYAHNILWDGSRGEAILSDFGGASFLPSAGDEALKLVEVRAFGLLVEELLDRVPEGLPILENIRVWCLQPQPRHQPAMQEVVRALS